MLLQELNMPRVNVCSSPNNAANDTQAKQPKHAQACEGAVERRSRVGLLKHNDATAEQTQRAQFKPTWEDVLVVDTSKLRSTQEVEHVDTIDAREPVPSLHA